MFTYKIKVYIMLCLRSLTSPNTLYTRLLLSNFPMALWFLCVCFRFYRLLVRSFFFILLLISFHSIFPKQWLFAYWTVPFFIQLIGLVKRKKKEKIFRFPFDNTYTRNGNGEVEMKKETDRKKKKRARISLPFIGKTV